MNSSILKKGAIALALISSMTSLTVKAAADHHKGEHIIAALNSPDRPETDKARDEARKPLEVLTFAGIMPGMTVVDLNSGGGYYTEILSRTVGDKGTVYAHNGPLYWSFVENRLEGRFDNDRLANVKQLHDGTEDVNVPAGSVDMVISVLAYHDYFYTPEGRPEPEDEQAALASVLEALKPGGVFIVIDHVAPAGTGIAHANDIHRIDPETVKQQVLAAGFTLVDTSDILVHPEDSHALNVFDSTVRGKTDRFIFKFVK